MMVDCFYREQFLPNGVSKNENSRGVLWVPAIYLVHIEMHQLVNETSTTHYFIQYNHQYSRTTSILTSTDLTKTYNYQSGYTTSESIRSLLKVTQIDRREQEIKWWVQRFLFVGEVDTKRAQLDEYYSNSRLKAYINYIYKEATMSSKIQVKPLLSKHHLSTQHTVIHNNHHGYNCFEEEVQNNLRAILKRYPHLDRHKVRNLLEELENNLDLAIKILEEEESASNKILQEKKADIRKPLNLSLDQENRILKSSFLNIYKQVLALKKENEELLKKNDSLKSEHQNLKMMNRLLLQRQYSQSNLQESRDIC